MKKRACLLKRVSTTAESQDSSYINQEKQLVDLILKDEVVFDPKKDIFEDKFTGTKIQRKNKNNNGFDRLMELLNIEIVDSSNKDEIELSVKTNKSKKPYYDIIYCKSTSRFHRASYKGESILYLLKKIKVDIYYYDLGKYLSQMSDEEIKLYSLIDNKYSKTVSFNYRNNNLLKTKNREVMTRTDKLGFDRIKKNNHIYLVKNEEEFKTFELMKDLFVNKGYGSGKIAETLNDLGIKNKFGKEWHKSSVHNVLYDKHYCGLEKYYSYPDDYLTMFGEEKGYLENVPFEWLECEYIEKLETLEDYQLRESIFLQRTVDVKGKKGQKQSFQIPSKYCVCGICGRNYYSKGKTKNYREDERAFICSSKRFNKEHRIIDCMNHTFYENFFNEQLEKKANHFSLDLKNIYKASIESLEKLIIHLVLTLDSNFDEDVDSLNAERAELTEQREKLLDLYLSSAITKNAVEERLNKIGSNIETIEKKLSIYDNQKRAIKDSIVLINETLEKLKDSYCNVKESYSADEILEYVQQILVFPKGSRYIKANQVLFVFHTKAEYECFKIIDDVFKSDFINLLPPKTFTICTPKAKPQYYIVRTPKSEQKERAEELLKSL